jgi:hypothetical protein
VRPCMPLAAQTRQVSAVCMCVYVCVYVHVCVCRCVMRMYTLSLCMCEGIVNNNPSMYAPCCTDVSG